MRPSPCLWADAACIRITAVQIGLVHLVQDYIHFTRTTPTTAFGPKGGGSAGNARFGRTHTPGKERLVHTLPSLYLGLGGGLLRGLGGAALRGLGGGLAAFGGCLRGLGGARLGGALKEPPFSTAIG